MNAISPATMPLNFDNASFYVPAPVTLDFYQRGKMDALIDASIGALKFQLNKIAHGGSATNVSAKTPFLANIDALQFYVGRDEDGVLRGGCPHWAYLQNLCDPRLSDQEKFKKLCKNLADLPGNVAFAFKASPDLKDSNIVRAAFGKAGFANIQRKTYLFRGNAVDGDPIAKLKSDARNKVNKARRDLETCSMSVDEFFAFYSENLVNYDGKKSHFYLNIDHDMMKKGYNNLEIIAVRRKTEEGKEISPIEAAILCGWDADGYYKLMRITYRRDAAMNNGIEPHQHAIKMLVVEAMARATQMNMVLDVDGATPGGGTVYQRFGVFEEVLHDEFKRKTAQTFICKFCNPLAIENAVKAVKNTFSRLLAFTIPAVLFYS